ncbi:MAG: right-handed parallel beta-helix repeat-containing protein [Oscillospiraceae bacterium]|nr:right-handed parallel beta-helix repeat-containing protein [Oscillospiraceae bacterium]
MELSIYGGATADYSFTGESVAKMAGIDASDADEFYKVYLTLTGDVETLNSVLVRPYVKSKTLGFRYEGAPSTDNGPETDVATFADKNYTSLEEAVAAAEAAGGMQDITLIGDVNYKRPATIKMNGQIRFVVSGEDVTISGPVTFDGQKKEANTQLFRCTNGGKLTFKNGVSFVDIRNARTDDNVRTYGAVARVDGSSELVMENVTVKDCSCGVRGVVYVTGTSNFTAKNSTFTGNSAATGYGGAIAVYTADTVAVEGCTFTGNKAQTYGGAIYAQNDLTVNISNSTFTDNEILNNTSGAAVYVGKRATLMLDGVSVTGSIGKGAAATSGVYLWGASDAKSTFVIKGHNSIDGIAAQSASFPIVLKGAVTSSIGFYAAASTYTSFVSNGTLVLSGEKVADSYAAFTPTNSSYEFTSEGKLAVK